MTDFTFAWPATFTPDADGRVVVAFPDLPEALTDGADLDEALAEAADCLEAAIAARIAGREDIPRPSPLPGDKTAQLITCPAPTAQKAALCLALRAAGISKVALAATLGIDEKDVRRMLDPHHSTRPDRIDAAIAACGKTVRVTLADDPPGRRMIRTKGGRKREIRSGAALANERMADGLGSRIAAQFAGIGFGPDEEIEELRGEEPVPATFGD